MTDFTDDPGLTSDEFARHAIADQLRLRDNADKRRAFEALEDHYGEVWVLARTESTGVDLPASVKAVHKPSITLQVSDNLARPTRHALTEEGISLPAMSFGGITYACFVPWDAVFLLHGPRDEDGNAHAFRWGNPPPAKPKGAPRAAVNQRRCGVTTERAHRRFYNAFAKRQRKKLVRYAGAHNRFEIEEYACSLVEHVTLTKRYAVRIPRSLQCYRLDKAGAA